MLRCMGYSIAGISISSSRSVGIVHPCEGVSSVDACTVTALDAISAFAVPHGGAASGDGRLLGLTSFSGARKTWGGLGPADRTHHRDDPRRSGIPEHRDPQ